MGHRYIGVYSYDDDLTLLSPSRSALSLWIFECERYASEYNNMYSILFNCNKNKLLCFKGISCKPLKVGIEVSGQYVIISKSAVH